MPSCGVVKSKVWVTAHDSGTLKYLKMVDTMVSSFWGPVTSTTEWCERNYSHSSYIAEFYNTISNIPCIILALIGLINALRQRFEKRFSILHISNMILSIGSMLFHATLQHVQQQSDETPMVWEMLLYIYVLYSPDWHYRSTMPTFLFLYGIAFAIAHSQVRFGIGFKVHYIILCLLCVPRMYKYYLYTKEASAKRLAKLYVLTIFLASLCWLSDRIFCKKISMWPINPQGHALWHVLMGFNSYFANAFLMFCRAQQLGWSPKVKHFMGLFPYVKIQKPKTL
ncbi:alkaline ceramidase-like isoform X4 [Magnolia sinica]|uniref:alkaline ceramidase-like isoform X4 n=1 Tax=Magnolia sinica TaxID=86752 RepID=UPI0026589A6C|nr:alkaline ceramidase-like isoform X4 [Magnolia sinica]